MDYAVLMEFVSQLGANLATAGAETYRVEESVSRVLAAYGLQSRVYCVPNSLIITIMVPGALPMTQLCRMERHGNDLEAVERFSNLGRRICTEVPPPETALEWLEQTKAKQKKYALPVRLLGHVLVAWGFCVFFGGTWIDALCSAVCGLLLGLADHVLGKIKTNIFFQKIATAFIMAFAAYALGGAGWVPNEDTAVIGALMLLVPGLLFTNALRDIIFGDTNSGVNRIVEVLLIAAAVALGTAAAWELAVAIWGTPVLTTPLAHNALITCFVSGVACVGFVIIFNIHGRGKLLCALGGIITWAAFCLVRYLGGAELLCCFVATVAAAIFSEVMARVRKYPAISYLVISLLPLIPGAGIYHTAQQAIQGNLSACIAYGADTLATAGVMAVGILMVSTAVRVKQSYQK